MIGSAAKTAPKPVTKQAVAPVQHKAATRVTKSYGASDRQALDNLVQSGGNSR